MIVIAGCEPERSTPSSTHGPPRAEAAGATSIAAPAVAAALVDASGATVASPPARDEPPARLACVARYYVGSPERRGTDWFLVLPDGSAIPYDDHVAKSAFRAFEEPDLEDMYSPSYVTGPIGAITDPGQDPGRNRVDALFGATYGSDAHEVQASLTPWTLLGAKYPVHARVRPALDRVAAQLATLVHQDPSLANYFHSMGGTFVWRTIAGSKKVSTHAYGIAVDIATSRADYWRNARTPVWRNQIPASIVEAFEREGFIWGGRWFHYDTMHFEYRPELLDPACQPPSAP